MRATGLRSGEFTIEDLQVSPADSRVVHEPPQVRGAPIIRAGSLDLKDDVDLCNRL